jgi:hypothetical protein
VTSHTLTPTPAAGRRQESGRQAPVATDAPSTVGASPGPMTGAERSPDPVALVWDLTVHRLQRAFAECLATRPATHGGPTLPALPAQASTVRLAATRHAVDDIQSALRRMAAGSYGTCG